jgi:hypothetical protein
MLSDTEINALHEALDDEYKALATYDQVIADFGPVRPFLNIREAEARHIQALAALFARYDIAMPANTWEARAPHYASLSEACKAAVAGEIENDSLYERLLQATRRLDILTVFTRLQDASRTRHLPAFQRCLDRETALPMPAVAARRRQRRRRGRGNTGNV